jgi:hypothetical protein
MKNNPSYGNMKVVPQNTLYPEKLFLFDTREMD